MTKSIIELEMQASNPEFDPHKFAELIKAATEDAMLEELGLDPATYRTDGGVVNYLKVKAAIRNRSEYPQKCQHEWAYAPASLGGQICKLCGRMK